MLHFGVKKVWTSSFLTFWESEDKLVEPFNQLVSFLEEVDILWENGSNWPIDDQWKQYYTETSQLFFLQINSVVSRWWEHWLLLILKESHPIYCSLTHLFPMHTFSIPWKHQKALRWKGCVGNKWVNIYTTEIDIQFLGNKISKIAFWLKLGVVSKFHF